MEQNTIRLSLPAEPTYARSVRMLAANLATVCGMTIDDVEDVRMAAEEGFVYSCATLDGPCDITFVVGDGQVGVDFGLGPVSGPEVDEVTQLAGLLIEALCDEYVVDDEASVLHLLKRAVG